MPFIRLVVPTFGELNFVLDTKQYLVPSYHNNILFLSKAVASGLTQPLVYVDIIGRSVQIYINIGVFPALFISCTILS